MRERAVDVVRHEAVVEVEVDVLTSHGGASCSAAAFAGRCTLIGDSPGRTGADRVCGGRADAVSLSRLGRFETSHEGHGGRDARSP
jgi:hypothetical protein